MEKGEFALYAVTLIAFVSVIYVALGAVSKVPGTTDQRFLTGNVVINSETNFQTGDNLSGKIILTKKETDAYGSVLLMRDGKPIVAKTFNLGDIPGTGAETGYSINLADLIDYEFREKGRYELFFSVPDLNINVQREFVVR